MQPGSVPIAFAAGSTTNARPLTLSSPSFRQRSKSLPNPPTADFFIHVPMPTLAWDDAVSKGDKLLAMTLSEEKTTGSASSLAQESEFLDQSSVHDWGYVRTLTPLLEDPEAVYLNDSHLHRTMHHGKIYPATRANFGNIVDRRRGTLKAMNNFGPAYALSRVGVDSDLQPELQRWSDMAYLQWTDPSFDDLPGDLRLVLRCFIVNADTLAIIDCVEANHREKNPNWSRADYPSIGCHIDEDDAKALLGTPNGSGVAWLLAQHRQELGWKTVEYVTVSWDQGAVQLAFQIGNVRVEAKDPWA
jgi:hypothetical protein